MRLRMRISTGPARVSAARAAVPGRRRSRGAARSGVCRQRHGRASAMYLGSTGLDSGAGLPSASTGLAESPEAIAASSVRANPVLSGACPAPSTRSDHPLMLSYQRRAAAPYGSAYQPPERFGDPAAWILCLRKVKVMAISSRRSGFPRRAPPVTDRGTYCLTAILSPRRNDP